MSNSPVVTNKNERTISILKVVGIYLLTFFILFLIFRNYSTVPKEEEDIMKALREENESLRDLVFHADTMASLIRMLIDFDKQEKTDPGGVLMNKSTAERDFNAYTNSLIDIKGKEKIPKYINDVGNILDLLVSNRKKINDLNDEVMLLKEEKAKIEEKARENANAASQAVIQNLNDRIATLEEEKLQLSKRVQTGNEGLVDSNEKIAEKNEDIADLKQKITDIESKVVVIEQYVKERAGKKVGLVPECKLKNSELTVLYEDISNLKLFIEK